MNKKAITTILTKKHNDFVKSINDDKVKELVDKNSIITGGAIASMLLGEKVNDFDYYFRTKETALEVAIYYLNIVNNDNKEKLSVKVTNDRISINVPDSVKFPSSKKKYQPVYLSSNAITLTGKVQLIIRFWGEPDEIHKNYDFMHCTNYWTSWNKRLVLRNEALQSLLSKELVYEGSLYPVSSVIRARKFIEKGWTINAGQFLKMCYQISQLDLNNVEVLREQLMGIDASLFNEVIKRLNKEESVTISNLSSVIDSVFGED